MNLIGAFSSRFASGSIEDSAKSGRGPRRTRGYKVLILIRYVGCRYM